ncbi:MAG: hypothetical protein IJS69_03050 [Selenomonadaceae bacterium]|nr:hypothetical protein [Selenomonadaceae bacterium]
MHDNTLTTDNREKFSYIAGQYGQAVKFYNVEILCADKLNEMINLVPAVKTARVSIGAFYRLLIPQVLAADIVKCIYLDSDMLVNLDISELWRVEIGNKVFVAVREMEANAYNYEHSDAAKKYLLNEGIVKYEDYFNSGLLVMNLNYLRRSTETILRGIKWRGEHTQCNCFDQDILNYLFSKKYIKLPVKFDRFICNERSQGVFETRSAIYHCTALNLQMDDVYNRLWMKYFIRTPWFDEDTIGRLYDGFRQVHTNLKQSMINVSAIMSGKSRAFFTTPNNLDAIKKNFCHTRRRRNYPRRKSRVTAKINRQHERFTRQKNFLYHVAAIPIPNSDSGRFCIWQRLRQRHGIFFGGARRTV